MKIKGIVFEDFVNYKLPVMYIACPYCSFKCDIENGCQCCQNLSLVEQEEIEISKENLIEQYINNPITQGIVFGGLEPFDSVVDLVAFIDCFRRQYQMNDPIIIYTGYTEDELETGRYWTCYGKKQNNQMLIDYWNFLKRYGVIVKFGRYRPNEEKHFDNILGVNLASNNQYAREFPNEYSFE